MTEQIKPQDLHGLFLQNSSGGDFLNARKLEDKIGLCLSGGGYRATIYHLGALIRLNEAGYLGRIDEFASVSGGSITAALLALRWGQLDFDKSGRAKNFREEVVEPLLKCHIPRDCRPAS